MKAKIKFENKINFDELLQKLKSISKLEANKKISFEAFVFQELEWTMLSLINFGCKISVESKKHLLIETFKDLVYKNDFEKGFFFEQLQNRIKVHQSKQKKIFYLLASISISRLPFRTIQIGDCIIQVHGRNFPNPFKKHRNQLFKSHNFEFDEETFTKVSVEVSSGDSRDAYEKAFYHLEILRGLLCLVLNSNFEIRFGERTLRPINKVRQGIIASLHLPQGDSVDKNFFYIQDYKKAKLLELGDKMNSDLKKSVKWLVSHLNKCGSNHKIALSEALVNYAGAFDESNKYICFLRSWTVLEILTNTDQNDLLIKRCIALHGSNATVFQRQKLEALRAYRNEYVHEGGIGLDGGIDPMMACYSVQFFVYNLIIKFHLRYSGFFENIDEANSFLDSYSTDLKQLKSRKKILEKVIKRKARI